MAVISVIGYAGGGPADHGQAQAALVAGADLVVGGRRHLDAFDVPEERRVVLGRLDPALAALAALPEHARGVVIASGDPGFFGIVRRLRAAGLQVSVRPQASSVATAFGRVGLAWEDALVVSAHGREMKRAVNVARAHPHVAVMTGPGAGLPQIAAALHRGWPRDYVLAERLGESDERVRHLDADQALALDEADVRQPNVVLVLDPSAPPRHDTPWLFGAAPASAPPDAPGLRDGALGALAATAVAAGPGDLVHLVGDDAQAARSAVAGCGAAVYAAPHLRQAAAAAAEPAALLAPDAAIVALPGHPDAPPELVAYAAQPTLRTLAVLVSGRAAAQAIARVLPARDWQALPVPTPAPPDHAAPTPDADDQPWLLVGGELTSCGAPAPTIEGTPA